ncbi:hypothetical protein ABZ470_31785 [Streptosporangium sp. NPDC020072]|uniref:hypothetical protein n=1 Tax=Streptosporangium sp. NPDC020072 TaxID=3154788 RepID=UPI0034307751
MTAIHICTVCDLTNGDTVRARRETLNFTLTQEESGRVVVSWMPGTEEEAAEEARHLHVCESCGGGDQTTGAEGADKRFAEFFELVSSLEQMAEIQESGLPFDDDDQEEEDEDDDDQGEEDEELTEEETEALLNDPSYMNAPILLEEEEEEEEPPAARKVSNLVANPFAAKVPPPPANPYSAQAAAEKAERRKVGMQPTTAPETSARAYQDSELRAWAKSTGIKARKTGKPVGDNGKIALDIRNAFEKEKGFPLTRP